MLGSDKKKVKYDWNTYRCFWSKHVHEHQDKRNRDLHFVGLILGIVAFGAGVLGQNYWLCLGLPLLHYLFSAIGHYYFERNRPETARNPVWSWVADLHMSLLMCVRRMDREVRRMRVLNQ